MKKSVLTKEIINKIIELYVTKTVPSTHELGKMFNMGHKKISTILKDNGVEINKKGGQKKYSEKIFNQEEIDNTLSSKNKKIIAICKVTGKVYNDYSNKSGTLILHIKDNFKDTIIPSQYKRNMLFKTTGKYWHENFFNLMEIDIEQKPVRKCRYCEWSTIDIDNKSGYYENHLKVTHNKTLDQYLNDFPEDSILHKNHVERVKRYEYLSNDDNSVTCEICGEKFGMITNTHLKNTHNITMKKYVELYGNPKIVSNSISHYLSEKAIYNNEHVIKYSSVSKEETELVEFIRNLGSEVITNDRKILKGKEIDIIIPELKIAIEYNGILWHSEDFGGKDLNYHLNKTLLMNFAGYKLIHIFSDEWLTKKDLVKEKLKHILNKSNSTKIGARKCTIKKVDFHLKNDFLNQYHIQGEDLSPISYGAYYNDELVGVMCFSNNRGMNNAKNDKNIFVLNRFATNHNYVISGLANKMLKQFIKEYNPHKVISFADRRWTLTHNNNLYTKLGFNYLGNSKQSYFYFKKSNTNDRFHKFRMSKKNLIKKYNFDKSLTEWQMIKNLGYDRIWDCGLFKYELILK